MKLRCSFCDDPVSHRLRKGCKQVFCSQQCVGLSKRQYVEKAQKVADKRLYDMEYRRKNRASMKAKKAAYFQRTYDPIKAAKERKKIMPRHIEYCRQPKYKAYKSKYDAAYRAKKYFGPFWESALLVNELDREIGERATFVELATAKGTLNKSLTRRREYEKLVRC